MRSRSAVAVTSRQQAESASASSDGAGQIVAHAVGGTAGTLLEQFGQACGTIQPCGFEFGQRDPRRLRKAILVASSSSVTSAVRLTAFQQALIDVADLLHVQRPVQRAPLNC